jgi:hypothetical protein
MQEVEKGDAEDAEIAVELWREGLWRGLGSLVVAVVAELWREGLPLELRLDFV